MKKFILFFSAVAFCQLSAMAQQKQNVTNKSQAATPAAAKPQLRTETKAVDSKLVTPAGAQTNPGQNLNADLSMKFNEEEHSFGNVPEGPSVTTDFEFKNIGKEPIVLSNVQASCGCTTPAWTKEPVMPGKTGKISATYNTQGRPGPIMKTITVTSNVGTKVLKITGSVEKAPESSVPANDNSIMRH